MLAVKYGNLAKIFGEELNETHEILKRGKEDYDKFEKLAASYMEASPEEQRSILLRAIREWQDA